jgi:hypothetical protein
MIWPSMIVKLSIDLVHSLNEVEDFIAARDAARNHKKGKFVINDCKAVNHSSFAVMLFQFSYPKILPSLPALILVHNDRPAKSHIHTRRMLEFCRRKWSAS